MKKMQRPSFNRNSPNGDGAMEILRVWQSEQGQQFSLQVGVWQDPAAWGLLLADIARHAASAYAQCYGYDKESTFSRIVAGLRVELEDPSDH